MVQIDGLRGWRGGAGKGEGLLTASLHASTTLDAVASDHLPAFSKAARAKLQRTCPRAGATLSAAGGINLQRVFTTPNPGGHGAHGADAAPGTRSKENSQHNAEERGAEQQAAQSSAHAVKNAPGAPEQRTHHGYQRAQHNQTEGGAAEQHRDTHSPTEPRQDSIKEDPTWAEMTKRPSAPESRQHGSAHPEEEYEADKGKGPATDKQQWQSQQRIQTLPYSRSGCYSMMVMGTMLLVHDDFSN